MPSKKSKIMDSRYISEELDYCDRKRMYTNIARMHRMEAMTFSKERLFLDRRWKSTGK